MTDLFLVLDNEAKFQRNGDIKLFKVLLHPRRNKIHRNCNMLETEKPKSKPSFKEIEDNGTVLKVENQNIIDRKLEDDSRY